MKYGFMLLMAVFLLACAEEKEASPALPAEADDGILSESFGVEYLFSDSASLKANMQASHVVEKEEGDKDQAKEKAFFLYDGVLIKFFDRFGRPESFISANEGIYWEDKGLAELKGNVVLKNNRGEKLETEQLFWNERKEEIYTDLFVRVQTEGKIITADSGLVSNTSFTEYEFRGVRGEFEYDEEGL